MWTCSRRSTGSWVRLAKPYPSANVAPRGENFDEKQSSARERGCRVAGVIALCFALPSPLAAEPALSAHQQSLLAGARACLGDRYDDAYCAGGPPPRGRGACTDVIWHAFRAAGVDLQSEVDRDEASHPALYPGPRDRNIDYRRCPVLNRWFKRHTHALTRSTRSWSDWRAGDVVFWNLTGDGVPDHTGIVSSRRTSDGRPWVIHNFPPECKEEDALLRWTTVAHYRLLRLRCSPRVRE